MKNISIKAFFMSIIHTYNIPYNLKKVKKNLHNQFMTREMQAVVLCLYINIYKCVELKTIKMKEFNGINKRKKKILNPPKTITMTLIFIIIMLLKLMKLLLLLCSMMYRMMIMMMIIVWLYIHLSIRYGRLIR